MLTRVIDQMDTSKRTESRSNETDCEKPLEDKYSLSLVPIISSISLCDEVDNADYRYEAIRLQSFQNWPLSRVEAKKLVAAGFYYTGHRDRVRCFECRIEIDEWTEDDNPMVNHQRWSPRCRFIRKINCDNVPIGVQPNTIVPTSRSADVCGYGLTHRVTSGPDNRNFSNKLPLPSTFKLDALELKKHKAPTHPEYNSYGARLRTFETWPKSLQQTKEQLADAGFYYTGRGDETMCFYCGGGLKEWEPHEDPWEEHAKWFSKCIYLLMIKGQLYVSRITSQHTSLPSVKEAMHIKLPNITTNVQSVEPVKENETENNPGPSGSQMNKKEGIENCTESINTVGTKLEIKEPSNGSKCIDDIRLCKICYNAELGVVFLPCGHMVACIKCAPGLITCAVCRELVTMTVRAFLS